MAIVGFNFTKVSAERKPVPEGNINIESNAGITSVEEVNSIDSKKTMLKFSFHFICKYEPGLGKIELDGELLEIYDKDFASVVLSMWSKDNKIHQEVLQEVFNTVLARSNTEAVIIGRDMGLPSPIQMPRVDVKSADGKIDKAISNPAQKQPKKK